MAVDSRDKRASVLGFGLAALLVLPEPGVIDQPDRQHLAYSYRGIVASSPTPAEAVIVEISADDRVVAVRAVDRTVDIDAVDRIVWAGLKGE